MLIRVFYFSRRVNLKRQPNIKSASLSLFCSAAIWAIYRLLNYYKSAIYRFFNVWWKIDSAGGSRTLGAVYALQTVGLPFRFLNLLGKIISYSENFATFIFDIFQSPYLQIETFAENS